MPSILCALAHIILTIRNILTVNGTTNVTGGGEIKLSVVRGHQDSNLGVS